MPDSLTQQIRALSQKAKVLEPEKQMRDSWLNSLAQYTHHFYDGLSQRPAAHSSEKLDLAPLISFNHTSSFDELLKAYQSCVVESGIDTASGKYMGFIPGGGIYPSAIGDYLAAVSNTYGGAYLASPGAVVMERSLLELIASWIGYDKTSAGNLTSGGSIANLTALITARDAHHIKSHDIEKTVIYLTSLTHHSVTKALHLMSFGEAIVRIVPVDSCYRMNSDALMRMIDEDKNNKFKPWLIVASAGTTDLGSVDPISELADIAARHHLWLHVDGAYGGFFVLTEHGKTILNEIHRADSVALDPHKGLFIPYGLGAVLVKNGTLLKNAMSTTIAPYMQDTENHRDTSSPNDLSPELTKHFRAVRLWLPIKLFGIQPFRAALEEKLLLATYFAHEISQMPDADILCQPQLSIVAFRFKSGADHDIYNRQLLEKINQSGLAFLTSTTINHSFYIRMACLSIRTHLEEIQTLIDLIKKING